MSKAGAWLCDLFEQPSLREEMEKTNHLIYEEAYTPQPYLGVDIDEHFWMQVLATIDVSAMSKGTNFYDKLGYEVVLVRMIQI